MAGNQLTIAISAIIPQGDYKKNNTPSHSLRLY